MKKFQYIILPTHITKAVCITVQITWTLLMNCWCGPEEIQCPPMSNATSCFVMKFSGIRGIPVAYLEQGGDLSVETKWGDLIK